MIATLILSAALGHGHVIHYEHDYHDVDPWRVPNRVERRTAHSQVQEPLALALRRSMYPTQTRSPGSSAVCSLPADVTLRHLAPGINCDGQPSQRI